MPEAVATSLTVAFVTLAVSEETERLCTHVNSSYEPIHARKTFQDWSTALLAGPTLNEGAWPLRARYLAGICHGKCLAKTFHDRIPTRYDHGK
ncbi:MAG: hypothetical protein N2595_09950 [bacterium]|nr:hypothetical protein [bacterium]